MTDGNYAVPIPPLIERVARALKAAMLAAGDENGLREIWRRMIDAALAEGG